MLSFTDPNIAAIAVTWLICVTIGALWYSPIGFGKLWSKLSGANMLDMPKDLANKAIAAVSIASLVQVLALAVLINSLQADTALKGLSVGIFVTVGFIAATTVGNNAYSRLSWKFWLLNASFFLVVMPINAIILSLWR